MHYQNIAHFNSLFTQIVIDSEISNSKQCSRDACVRSYPALTILGFYELRLLFAKQYIYQKIMSE
jgi:hypothetical protein